MAVVTILTTDREHLWSGDMAFVPNVGTHIQFIDGPCTYHEVVHVSYEISSHNKERSLGATVTVRASGTPKEEMRAAVAAMGK